MDNKDIFVDFDGTICPNKNGEIYAPEAPPSLACMETLRLLQKAGHRIVIYSVRSNQGETNKPYGHNEMLEYLDKYKVPFDDIDSSKPHFRMIIDDKALGVPLDSNKNVNWTMVQSLIEKKLKGN